VTTLRKRLALRYGAIVAICVSLLGGLAHHEFVNEPREREELGIPELPESAWGEYVEVFFYGMIPLILGVGWWLMRRSLMPINALAESIERIHASNLHEPLPSMGTGDEVDRLTVVFNAMTRRLHQAFQQIFEFTLHASHELKTPLTVMRAQLETAMRDAESLPAAQRDWMPGLLDEIERLATIVDGLTLLTKADTGQLAVEWEPIWLAELMQESFQDAQILAEPYGVRVTLVECADLVTIGDRHRSRQVLLNLIDNAIKYNRPQGTVTLALRPAGEEAEIEIVNTGAGIPPELQERIFDGFVRGDEARNKAIEGCGLGLAIVRCIVEAYCGSITVSSVPGETTTVVVRLPQADSRRPSSGARVSHG